MIIAHYAHRLPADYDVQIIRNRAQARGNLFDAIPELYFKAFLLRERGRFGAIANEYSSLYLWRADQGFRDFLVDGRTKSVTSSFGRPQIETRFALDALKGEGREARFLYKQEQNIPLDAELTSAFAEEIARNRETARASRRVRGGRRRRCAKLEVHAHPALGEGAGRTRAGHGVPGALSREAAAQGVAEGRARAGAR